MSNIFDRLSGYFKRRRISDEDEVDEILLEIPEFDRMLSEIHEDGSNAQEMISNYFKTESINPLSLIGIAEIYNIDDVSTRVAQFIAKLCPPDTSVQSRPIMMLSAHGVFSTEDPAHIYADAVLKRKKADAAKNSEVFDEEDYKKDVVQYRLDIQMAQWMASPKYDHTITEPDAHTGFRATIKKEYDEYADEFGNMYHELFGEFPSPDQVSAYIRMVDPIFNNSTIRERLILNIMEATGMTRAEANASDIFKYYEDAIKKTTHVRQVHDICGVMTPGVNFDENTDLNDIRGLSSRAQEQLVVHIIQEKMVYKKIPVTVVSQHLELFFIRYVLRAMYRNDHEIPVRSNNFRENQWARELATQSSWKSYRVKLSLPANTYQFKGGDEESADLYPNYGLHIITGEEQQLVNLMDVGTNNDYDINLKKGEYGSNVSPLVKMVRIALYKLRTKQELDIVGCISLFSVINPTQTHIIMDSSCQHTHKYVQSTRLTPDGTGVNVSSGSEFPQDSSQREPSDKEGGGYGGGKTRETRKKGKRKINSKRKKSKQNNTKRKTRRNKLKRKKK